MLFRSDETSEIADLTFEQLRDLVRTGTVLPTALVCDSLITKDEWWTIDNLRLFHNCSPRPYTPGPQILALVAADAARAAEAADMSEHLDDLTIGDLFERAMGLQPLDEIIAVPGVVGVSRLAVMPAFHNNQAWTFIFKAWGVQIEITASSSSVWYETRQRGRDARVDATVQTNRLPFARAPHPMQSWKDFVAAAQAAPQCLTLSEDGIIYRHMVRGKDPRESIDVDWQNPSDPNPCALLNAYKECIQAANLAHPEDPTA